MDLSISVGAATNNKDIHCPEVMPESSLKMFECESFDMDVESAYVVGSEPVCYEKSRNILGGEGDVLIKGRRSTSNWPRHFYERCVLYGKEQMNFRFPANGPWWILY